MWEVIKKNPISTFAVMLVMATGIVLTVITFRLLDILTSPEWCAKAIQAERITPGNTFVGLTSCTAMSMEQVKSLATALLISIGGQNLVLLVLVVVVIAGARASWKLSAQGIEGSVGRDAAITTAAAAGAAAGVAAATATVTNIPSAPPPEPSPRPV